MNQPNEEALVADAKAGSKDAFEALLRLNSPALTSWIKSRVGARIGGKVEVEDLVQETQLRALQSIHRFSWRGENSFRNWLRAIAEHLLWNLSQKRSTRELSLTVERSGSVASPSRHLRRDERFERLERAMSALRPDEQEAVRLARLEGLRIREIAHRMQKSESAVKSLVARSLRKLRESIGDTESFHLPDRQIDLGEARHDE